MGQTKQWMSDSDKIVMSRCFTKSWSQVS